MFKLAVLNPGGRDRQQMFPDFAGAPEAKLHPPVNYHGFAACSGGGFFREADSIPDEVSHVLLLVRRDVNAARQALIDLRRGKRKTVAIALKEAGASQVAEFLSSASRLRAFREICQRAHGAIATTPELIPLFRGAGCRAVEFIPTPYPTEDPRWNFAQSDNARTGIFVGTREFSVPSRNHAAALLAMRSLAEPMQERVTVVNETGWRGRRVLSALDWPAGLLRIIDGCQPYPEYLRLIASHKIVLQFDTSAVPGQVAGDALLCRTPCVGGDGAVERLVFPALCGFGRTREQLFDLAAGLLEHPHDREGVVTEALGTAATTVSFATVARKLEGFFSHLG
ncbi:MAG TPA: hypothetical protein VFV83_09075 [Chthoniobacteraceae bacterium]|nr:hypothetical protein [Chthoniobacteraceae bacterium]